MDQKTEDTGVNINNSMPGNPPEPNDTNDNNASKVETVNESDAKEDKNENKETIQEEEGFEFRVNSTSTAEQHVWEASQKHGLHLCPKQSFKHRYPSDHYTNLMVHIFKQLNLKQGMKIFGSKGMKATKSEIQQMNGKVMFHPIKGEQLTKKQKKGALRVLMF